MKKYLIVLLFGCVALQSFAQKKTYEYDDVNRLRKAHYWEGSVEKYIVIYTYDAVGNRLTKVISGIACQAPTATLSGSQTINAGQTANLTVTFTGGGPYSFVFNGTPYDGINSATLSIPVTPTVGTTSYTLALSSVSSACGGAGTVSGSATVTVNPTCTPPQPPTVSSATINSGQTATLTASNCGGTVNWYSTASGGTSLTTGTSFTTPALTFTTTYFASCAVGSCVSTSRGSGMVTVGTTPSGDVVSIKIGSWHDPATWDCNCVPNNTHTVEIKQNHTVTVSSGDANLRNLRYSGGILTFQNARILCFGCTSSNLTAGLVAYYPFNGNANDASGNSNNGAANRATLTNDRKTGNSNGAYNFGGVNSSSFIEIPNTNSLQFTNGFSVSLWYSLNTYAGMNGFGRSVSQGYHMLFAKDADWGGFYAGTSGNAVLDSVYYNLTNRPGDGTTNFDASAAIKGTAANLNIWIQMSYVVENGAAKIFRNGVLIKSQPISNSLNFSTANTKNLYLGRYSSFWYPLNGKMDDVRVYNRALNNAEVLDIYNIEKP